MGAIGESAGPGRAVVVGVGARQGVGAAVAHRLAREGLHVFVAGRTKDRLEDKAEARLDATRTDLADLERGLANILAVDPQRLEEETLTPARSGVKVLRRDLVWVY